MGRFFLVLGVLVALTVLLFIPIFLETDAHYDMNRRKFTFAVYLYKFIKLIGGYASTYQGGIALHVSEKKAILIPYAQMNNERKKFSFLKTFRLRSLILTTETGAEYLLPTSLAHGILRTYFFIIGGRKERIENNLWLTDGDVLRISFHCVFFFNLFILLCNFIKFLKEKLKILWLKNIKKSTT